MASAILIFLWVQFQVSFDRFHSDQQNLYRVVQDQFYTNGEVFHVGVTPSGISRKIKENFPGVVRSTRYFEEATLFQVGETKMMESIQMVDTDFFSMFSFPLLKGTPESVFKDPHGMVISEKISTKYFGKNNPVGKTAMLDGKYPFTITGVIKDNPKNTRFNCEIMIPIDFLKELGRDMENVGNNWLETFVQLRPGTSKDLADKLIKEYIKKNYPDNDVVFYLQPMERIHLYYMSGGGPIRNVRIFSIIAVLIILIAAINFTNLSTAMAVTRFTEIGIKKSYGANRNILVSQFLSETFFLTIISMFIALILTESFLPWYNMLLQTQLKVDYTNGILIVAFFVILVVTTLLSGAYPAFLLSSLKPVSVLKSGNAKNRRSLLREILVVLQFSLAIVLIINTLIIKKQRDFLANKEIGIQKDNIIYMPVRGELKKKYELFKTQVNSVPGVVSVCYASHIPTTIYSNGGGYDWQEKPAEVDPLVTYTLADFDYLKTFGIKMHEGRFYDENQYVDTNNIVINKTFADIIGLRPILGETIKAWGMERKIIGVTEDFNFKSLSSKIEPLVINCFPDGYEWAFCKLSTNDLKSTLKKIEQIHENLNETYPFEYHFLNQEFDELYSSEKRQGRIFNIFSILAICISCLGLFGLSSFLMAQRTKEIGIRKANGATTLNIMALFSMYYTRWIMISFLVALPVSYYFAYTWLKNYAYRTQISWWIFSLAGALAFLIALITVGWQSWKAARKNPIEALRYE